MTTLPDVLGASFALLDEGARDPSSVWRYPALATAAPDGRPGIRTIVLRRFDKRTRIAELHTDARSPKMAALARNPHAALHVWDAERRLQLRLDGIITLADEDAAQHAWDALHDGSRATYAVAQPPGTPIVRPDSGGPPQDQRAARQVFRVLAFRIEALEYLSLAGQPHVRARFGWRGQTCDATWLIP